MYAYYTHASMLHTHRTHCTHTHTHAHTPHAHARTRTHMHACMHTHLHSSLLLLMQLLQLLGERLDFLLHAGLELLSIVIPPLHLLLVLLAKSLVGHLQTSLRLLKRVNPERREGGKGERRERVKKGERSEGRERRREGEERGRERREEGEREERREEGGREK